MSQAVQNYIDTHSKSQLIGFVLTFLLGPLGLFYSSWVAALILCVIAFSTAFTIFIPVICWLLSILVGFFAVNKHNEKVKAAAQLGIPE
nr:hypothetical protein [Thiomicrorhabdus sp.]